MPKETRRKVNEIVVSDADYMSVADLLKLLKEKGISEDQFENINIERETEYEYGESYNYVRIYLRRDETAEEEAERLKKEEKARRLQEQRDRDQLLMLKKKLGEI